MTACQIYEQQNQRIFCSPLVCRENKQAGRVSYHTCLMCSCGYRRQCKRTLGTYKHRGMGWNGNEVEKANAQHFIIKFTFNQVCRHGKYKPDSVILLSLDVATIFLAQLNSIHFSFFINIIISINNHNDVMIYYSF